jgi:hypothetical protein
MPRQVYQLVQSKLQHITEMQLRKRNTKHGIFFKKHEKKKTGRGKYGCINLLPVFIDGSL